MKKIIIMIAFLALSKAYATVPVIIDKPNTNQDSPVITKVKEIIDSEKSTIPFDLNVEIAFANSLQNNSNNVANNPILTSIFNVINPTVQADIQKGNIQDAQSLMSEVILLIDNHNEKMK